MRTEDFLQDHLEISHFFSDAYEDTVCFSKDVQKAMKEYTKLKCQELLEIVYANIEIGYAYDEGGQTISKDSIFNAIDLEKFCS